MFATVQELGETALCSWFAGACSLHQEIPLAKLKPLPPSSKAPHGLWGHQAGPLKSFGTSIHKVGVTNPTLLI